VRAGLKQALFSPDVPRPPKRLRKTPVPPAVEGPLCKTTTFPTLLPITMNDTTVVNGCTVNGRSFRLPFSHAGGSHFSFLHVLDIPSRGMYYTHSNPRGCVIPPLCEDRRINGSVS